MKMQLRIESQLLLGLLKGFKNIIECINSHKCKGTLQKKTSYCDCPIGGACEHK